MAALRQRWPLALAVGVVLAIALLLWQTLRAPPGPPPRAPRISLIPAAPPPPPPPPKEEKRPEPPKEQKEVRVDQPAAPKDAPPAPPSQDLKMEGPAGDGPSPFAAGKVTREDIANLGKPGTGGGAPSGPFNPFANYATLLKGEVQRTLARDRELRQRGFRVEVQLWVARDGSVTRHELLGSTGDTDTDGLVRAALAAVQRVSQAPPPDMPQPIRLRVTTGRG